MSVGVESRSETREENAIRGKERQEKRDKKRLEKREEKRLRCKGTRWKREEGI